MLEQVDIVEVGRTPAMTGVDSQPVVPGVVKRSSVDLQRRHDRNIGVGQFKIELMFLDDGFVAPASRPVELGDHRALFLDADLIDTILVAVEGQETAVATKRQTLQHFDDVFGLQVCKRAVFSFRGSRHSLERLVSRGMKSTAVKLSLLGLLWVAGASAGDELQPDAAAYEAQIVEWRAERRAELMAPWGYLNLVGLYWLENEHTRIGSGEGSDIVFPDLAAPEIGVLELGDEGVFFNAGPDAVVTHAKRPVQSILFADDTTADPVTLFHRSLVLTIIKRDSRYALRLRDLEHPALRDFAPLEYYPINPAFRLTATLQPFETPKIVNVNTTIEGLGYRPESPGTLSFEIDGVRHELEAYAVGDQLFLVFADQTTGRETYPAGRFVYTDWPDEDGKTTLDFNKAYNPPCAFNAFATCPVASPRNRLKTRIDAGETYDPTTHSVPDGYR